MLRYCVVQKNILRRNIRPLFASESGERYSANVSTDDTGARHDGKNGYCTHIGNELFAWFSRAESKSRINFLSCLGQGSDHFYVLKPAPSRIWNNKNCRLFC